MQHICDFFDFPVLSFSFSRTRAQVVSLDRFSRFMAQTTCFRIRILGVRRTVDDVICAIVEMCPKTP